MIAEALLAAYVLVSTLLFLQGINGYVLVRLRRRDAAAKPAEIPESELPLVTVQLPIFNERYVLPRLLDAVAALDWPRDRLEIQILDDSTDDTSALASQLAAEHRARGIDVRHIRREVRHDAKAGALKEGLAVARGSAIAVFDADFVPRADFLRRLVPHLADPSVACVQARWSHVNEGYSWLTRAVAVGMDGHFAVEQRARSRSGLFLNFNGTAGVWRRDAIEEAGNWAGDTLAEDLDLSYRAQLAGRRIVYREDVECPAEIPVQIQGFKRQQFRWAKGSIQCARKHLGAVLRSRRLTPFAKLQAALHLTAYAVHPLMLALFLLLVPVALLVEVPFPFSLVFLTAALGPPLVYATGQRDLHPSTWRARLSRLVSLTLLGTGIAVSNTRAVAEGLVLRGGEFARTPKFAIEAAADSWRDKSYALKLDGTVAAEGILALAGLTAVPFLAAEGKIAAAMWVLLFSVAFGTTCALSLAHRPRAPTAAEAALAPA